MTHRWLRYLKCLLVGHLQDFTIADRKFCLRCRRFLEPRLVALPPLDHTHLAYLRQRGWTNAEITRRFPALIALL